MITYSDRDIALYAQPFDLEKAKAGAKLCQRNGCKARIICYDRRDYKGEGNPARNLIALADDPASDRVERIFDYPEDGYYMQIRIPGETPPETPYDLLIMP